MGVAGFGCVILEGGPPVARDVEAVRQSACVEPIFLGLQAGERSAVSVMSVVILEAWTAGEWREFKVATYLA